ncbi:syntaxin-18 [Monomorium pharaonis]|uniref:syntaxin-18 n=1 Tax=Monomorium pharaonis TaxID=307658 RepID=UPI00063EE9E8|nr:syntaxin-18 [Monomorium pharaonis]XP_012532434.1 syntaxin-18 [Monomorium pharaonis]
MDVSALFKASVKVVNLRNKDLGMLTEGQSPSRRQVTRTGRKSTFNVKAHTVVTQISKLREFLLENRRAYLNFSRYLPTAPRMTDVERDEIDLGAQRIMSTCSQLIKELKREVAASTAEISQQNVEHREIILVLIEDYLKNVCKIYSEQRAMRVKRTMETRRIAKLQSDPANSQPLSSAVKKLTERTAAEDHEARNGSNDLSPMKIQEINGDVNQQLTYEEEPSAEDIQMFESENEQLYNELNTMTEEVKQIESKVVHIAELQKIFTEKVLDQDSDLDRLMTTVIGSTENVKEANKQIRQAIQRNASSRVWFLFFFLVMSFTLLFLNWYNA